MTLPLAPDAIERCSGSQHAHADDDEDCREDRPQDLVRHPRTQRLPKKMPGREPMTSEPSNIQSTDPRSQWPTPAIKVSGTAWVMSEPTSRAIGVRG